MKCKICQRTDEEVQFNATDGRRCAECGKLGRRVKALPRPLAPYSNEEIAIINLLHSYVIAGGDLQTKTYPLLEWAELWEEGLVERDLSLELASARNAELTLRVHDLEAQVAELTDQTSNKAKRQFEHLLNRLQPHLQDNYYPVGDPGIDRNGPRITKNENRTRIQRYRSNLLALFHNENWTSASLITLNFLVASEDGRSLNDGVYVMHDILEMFRNKIEAISEEDRFLAKMQGLATTVEELKNSTY